MCEKIKFNPEEIEQLHEEAVQKRQELKKEGLHPRFVYEEERFEFVMEYVRGADPASSERQQKWLKKIKAEIRK